MQKQHHNHSTGELEKELKKFFGYDSFRVGQREVISAILEGMDTLTVMPTGSGKSICYQLPALLFSGITLVISPLVSLMRDQVAALGSAGIRAAYINSTLNAKQCSLALSNAAQGMYKIIYVAPERLQSPSFLSFAEKADIAFIAIDEAHCVSQWGHDFRRSYLGIKDFVAKLRKRPTVAALTATATEKVKADITNLLGLEDAFVYTTGYDRPNLYFGITTPADKVGYILDFIKRRPGKAGIIYCTTRKNTDILYSELIDKGISAVRYHAGLSEAERNKAQDDFIYDKCRVIVATNAFGMGIDKSNVSFVIHYNMPLSVEAYYQEAGRAGRDGMDAECVLLYSYSDFKLAEYLIDLPPENEDGELTREEYLTLKKINKEKLEYMSHLCKAKSCLRRSILSYFGEKYKSNTCSKCSYCLKQNTGVTLDSTKIIIGTLILKTGSRYGISAITDILAGRKTAKLAARGFDKLYEFGYMKLSDKRSIKQIINDMIEEGLLSQTEGEYPLLKVTDRFIRESGKQKFEIGLIPAPERVKADSSLAEELKLWRKNTAYKLGMPPYVIITDLTLNLIAIEKPKDTRALLKIKGISEKKAEKYGRDIISIIKKHL